MDTTKRYLGEVMYYLGADELKHFKMEVKHEMNLAFNTDASYHRLFWIVQKLLYKLGYKLVHLSNVDELVRIHEGIPKREEQY